MWVLAMLFLSDAGTPVVVNMTNEPSTITYETNLTIPDCRNGSYSRITVKEGVIELVISPNDFGAETLRVTSRTLSAEEKANIDAITAELDRAAPSIEVAPPYAAVRQCHNRLWVGSTLKAKWPNDFSSFPRVTKPASDLIRMIRTIADGLYDKAIKGSD